MSMPTASAPPPQRPGNPNESLASSPRYVCFGDFYLDLQKEELFKQGQRLKLQGKIYQALLLLLERPGDLVTRDELRARLWPGETHVNYDANVNTTVNKLRQILGDSAERCGFVETVPRRGYSFVAKVEKLNEPPGYAQRPAENSGPSGDSWQRGNAGSLKRFFAKRETNSAGHKSFFGSSFLGQSFLRPLFFDTSSPGNDPSAKWFAAGVTALLLAAILFGAALVLYSSR